MQTKANNCTPPSPRIQHTTLKPSGCMHLLNGIKLNCLVSSVIFESLSLSINYVALTVVHSLVKVQLSGVNWWNKSRESPKSFLHPSTQSEDLPLNVMPISWRFRHNTKSFQLSPTSAEEFLRAEPLDSIFPWNKPFTVCSPRIEFSASISALCA